MLLIEEDEEGCLQPRRTPWIGTASTAVCICASSSPSHGILSPPSCGTLSPLPWSLGSPIPPRTQACTPERISSSPLLSQSSSHTARAISKRHPPPNPPAPVLGCTGDHPSHPIPREALTHIVVLEGMEKVASQLPVVSWSARGIANATYVVWRILQEMSRDRQ